MEQSDTVPITAAWLATHIMGWHEWTGDDDYEGHYPMFRDWSGGSYLTIYEDDNDGNATRHFDPLHDLNDAWELGCAIAKKRDCGGWHYTLHVRQMLDRQAGTSWYAASFRLMDNEPSMQAKTPALAICRAAHDWYFHVDRHFRPCP